MYFPIEIIAAANKPAVGETTAAVAKAVQVIPLERLALTFLPVFVVIAILYRWSLGAGSSLYAMGRMLLQLLLIGYVLAVIFSAESPALVGAVLSVMLLIASWIALRPLQTKDRSQYVKALVSIALGGVPTFLLVTQVVLDTNPYFKPDKVIPLAGMIFAQSMTAISLAAERFYSELDRHVDYLAARGIALRAALIPITNSLFAVGLVSLPGLMTGQILSGVHPLIAARYQIMVMAMLYGAAGISAACYLTLVKPAETISES